MGALSTISVQRLAIDADGDMRTFPVPASSLLVCARRPIGAGWFTAFGSGSGFVGVAGQALRQRGKVAHGLEMQIEKFELIGLGELGELVTGDSLQLGSV